MDAAVQHYSPSPSGGFAQKVDFDINLLLV
jgi:hypothetical protein